jgi:15-cis-phytoene desaturase
VFMLLFQVSPFDCMTCIHDHYAITAHLHRDFVIEGRNKYRPSQVTPIPGFTMAGDWTSQKFLGSMEGAVLGGKLAAEVIARRAKGMEALPAKEIQQNIVENAKKHVAKEPLGVKGEGAIAFGGGATLTKKNTDLLREVDPVQFA